MDKGLCIPKEHGRDGSKGDSGLLPVVYSPLNANDPDEYSQFMVLFWECYRQTQDVDMGGHDEIEEDGRKIKLYLIEQEFDVFYVKGAKFQVAKRGSEVIGIMVYHSIYDCVLVIHFLFIEEKNYNRGIGCKFVSSIESPVKRVIFQTNKKIVPSQFLKSVEKFRRKIHDGDKFTVWEMDWLDGRRSSKECENGSVRGNSEAST